MILLRMMIAALAFGALMVGFVALRPLLPIDETRYLDVAWEMWLSGDYAHLTRNFAPYTHKPPLLFWLINLVWQATGVAEFPARLVAPACSLALLVGTGAFARRLWRDEPGLGGRAMLVLSGFTIFLIYASATMFDTLLGLAVLGGVAALWRIGEGGAGWRHWAAFGAALGIGTLAKGPVIAVHLLPLLLTMGFWAPAVPDRRRRVAGFALALAVAIGIVAFWLVPALFRGTPDFRQELLWTQSAARVAGGMAHDRPFWFLLVLMPVMLFPWGWSVAIWRAMAVRLRPDAPARMLAFWAVSALVLFSLISGKQAHYLLPAYPAVALLVARALPSAATPGSWRLAAIVPLVMGLAAFAVAIGVVAPPAVFAADIPASALLGVAACAFALSLGSLAVPALPRAVLLGAGTALTLHLSVAWTGI
ncbi:MAG: ArnT family glycosyltransferase, partial [Albidovulum sp.]